MTTLINCLSFLFVCFVPLSAQVPYDPPAKEWYDNQSWVSNRVNPYLGRQPNLPSRISIDCSSFFSPTGSQGRVSGQYGWRPKVGRMHRGIDISLPVNSPIYSSWSGVVRTTGYEAKGFGHYVVIRHRNGLETVYGHLNKVLVTRNDKVSSGDLIGLSGNTGRSTGPHLHFETRFLGGAFNPSLIIDFRSWVARSNTFLWTKNLYPKSANRSTLKTFRLKKDSTLEALCSEKDWDLEELCLMNGLLPDMELKKGRIIRIEP